jgi:hypothetical protein
MHKSNAKKHVGDLQHIQKQKQIGVDAQRQPLVHHGRERICIPGGITVLLPMT